MKFLLRDLTESFYTDGICFLMTIIGFITAIKRKERHKSLSVFLFYFGAYFILKSIFFVPGFVSHSFFYNVWYKVELYSDFIFTFFEYFVFRFFFKSVFKSLKNQIVLTLISYIFVTLFLVLYINDILLVKTLRIQTIQNLFSIQAVSLLIPCVLYYIEIFKKTPSFNLTNEPSFWVVTGLSFFMLCTLPYSIFLNYILSLSPDLFFNLYSIFWIFYIFLFCLSSYG